MFSWQFPYASQRMPVLAKNVVATSQPLAAQGVGVLLRSAPERGRIRDAEHEGDYDRSE